MRFWLHNGRQTGLRKGAIVRRIRAATKKQFTSEEKIRFVLEALRGQVPVSELCRREGLSAGARLERVSHQDHADQ
ncbi:MAG: transposase [Planctomycetaceae bacterium]|nr:transposase [Planctomycetaceae bacterium]